MLGAEMEAPADSEIEQSDSEVVVSSITDGDYVLRSVATGKCLDIAGGSTANGALVQEWTCNGSGAQTFHVASLGGGFFKITNVNSGKSIDIKDVSTAENAPVHQWDYVGALNQQFQIVSRGGTEFSIQPRHTNMALDLSWGNAADGTPIVQYPYIGGTNSAGRSTNSAQRGPAARRAAAIRAAAGPSRSPTGALSRSGSRTPRTCRRLRA